MPKKTTKTQSAKKGKDKQLEPTNKGGRPPHDKDEYFGFMQPFLELGYSLWKSALFADIPYMTVKHWFDNDESFRKRVILEQNKVSAVARLVIRDQIKAGKVPAAMTWLERMEGKEFGPPDDELSSTMTSEGDSIEAIGHDLKGLMANASDDSEATQSESDGDSSDDSETAGPQIL